MGARDPRGRAPARRGGVVIGVSWRIGGTWRSRMTLPSRRTAVSGSHATVDAAQLDALLMLAQTAQK